MQEATPLDALRTGQERLGGLEHDRSEARLAIALDRLHALERIIRSSPSVAFQRRLDPPWRVLYVSDNIIQFGYTPEELISGRISYLELMDPPHRDRALETVRDTLARGGETISMVYKIHTRTGDARWIEEHSHLTRSPDGAPLYWEGVATDVTDKRMARALRESEERYRRLIGTVTDYTYEVIVRDGAVARTRHGAGCEAVTGYFPEEYEANAYLWYNMIHPEDRSTVLRALNAVLEGHEVAPLEHRIVHKNGAVRWVLNTPVPRRSPQGNLRGYDGLIKDITDRRQAEEGRKALERQMLEAREQSLLERADRLSSLGLLTAGIAHEVNNPLQGMLNHLDNARHALPAASPARRSLDMVEHGIQTIAAMVGRLLSLGVSQDNAGETSSFRDTAVFVRDLLARQLETARVRLRLDDRAPDQRLAVPRRELVQILLNLIMNARDAMPDGGTVEMSCVRPPDGDIAVLRVADSGAGIPQDLISKIFTPFFTTKGARGTGLGLTVADSLIRARKGRIEVESEIGRGTVFTLTLPAATETPA